MRWSSGTLPTDRRFTGQREETGLGLYDGDHRDLHSFPTRRSSDLLRYADPTGHDPLDEQWQMEFEQAHGRAPDWYDRIM